MGRWRTIGSTVRGDAAVLFDVCCQPLVVRGQVMEVAFKLGKCCHGRVEAEVVNELVRWCDLALFCCEYTATVTRQSERDLCSPACRHIVCKPQGCCSPPARRYRRHVQQLYASCTYQPRSGLRFVDRNVKHANTHTSSQQNCTIAVSGAEKEMQKRNIK
jgi:hypothetical protein